MIEGKVPVSRVPPEKRILFCGDVLFNVPRLRLPLTALTVDMEENIRSIHRLADLEPEMVCFGHGEPLQKAAPRLRQFSEGLN